MTKQVCFLFIFFVACFSFAQKPGEWKWVHGSNGFGAPGVYGTKGVPSPLNTPGGREQMVQWTDTSGNLWLFSGLNSSGTFIDLWKFDTQTEQWTFMHGGANPQTTGSANYGSVGVPAPANTPYYTNQTQTWRDNYNNLWLYSSSGDLWKYDISNNMWTCEWKRPAGVEYKLGAKGVFLPTNSPGVTGRNAGGWADKNNRFWVYVNSQSIALNKYSGAILWQYDPVIKQWAWMGGDTSVFRAKTPGKGVASATSAPGATNIYAHWSDAASNLWMLAAVYDNGLSYSQSLWKYDISLNQFVWVGGDTAQFGNGVYGTKGVPAASNWPGYRYTNRTSWQDKCGNFWTFGGSGYANGSIFNGSALNDLWVYSPSLGQWMWKGGANTYNTTGSYGTKGVYAATNQPPGRQHGVGWEDKEGNFWIFGGGGGSNGQSYLNDLWKLYTLPEVTTKPAYCNAQDGTGTVDAFLGFPPYTYTWSNGTTTVTSTSATTTGLPSGFYTVNIVDAAGCVQTDTATVHRNDTTLNAKPTTTPAACGNNNGTASVTFGGGTSPFTYTWSSSSGSTYNTQNVSGLAPGLYTITINDKGNCSYSDTISVLPTALPKVTLKPTSTPCGSTNGTAVATVTGAVTPYGYSWSNGSTTANISNLGAGVYSLTVTDNVGCKQTVSTTVKANGSLSAAISSASVIDCYGDKTGSASISVTSGSGKSPYTYSWSSGLTDTLNAISNVIAGTYTVVVTDKTGCTVLKTITLKQPTQITVATTTTPSDCGVSNGSASVNASGGTTGYTYVWSTTETTSTINNVATGVYTVTIADTKNCTASATASVSENNSLVVFAGADTTILQGENVTLNASSITSTVIYSWSVLTGDNNSLSCTDCVNPNAAPTITSTYVVAISQNGCLAYDTITVFVDIKCSDEVFLPTAFSPNNDGVNDVFKVRTNKNCVENLLLQIFNRWGEKVFETNDANIGWNGVYRGQELNAGVFIYKLVYTSTKSGVTASQKGNVTLVK